MVKTDRNVSLRERNSFGIAARAREFAEFAGAADLKAFFGAAAPDTRWYVLGGGNNVLFTDDFDGTILHPCDRSILTEREDAGSVYVRVGAGVEWDDFVAWAVERGLGGVENLSLIPGYAGAAPIQNIGAYGAEAKDTIESVKCFLPCDGEVAELPAARCRFGYRDSIFKQELRGRAIVLSVLFRLAKRPQFHLRYGDVSVRVEELGGVSLQNIRQAVIAIRRAKLPDPSELGNAGSFFKNPVVPQPFAEALRKQYPDMPVYGAGEGQAKLAAGWLIDRCGWRGERRGLVGVHAKQALVLVNYGGATGTDVLDLARAVQSDVSARFGVSIEMEVNLL